VKRAALLFAACVACKGGGGGGNADAPAGSGARSITWTFDGSNYSGSLLAGATLMSNGAGGNALGIEASDQGGAVVLAIAVEPATPETMLAAGTYDTGSAAPFSTFQLTVGSAGTWAANGEENGSNSTGTLAITWLAATEIKGTFSATMSGSGDHPGSGIGQLTNGMFDLNIN
jgi:hypothetical protein